MQGDCLPELNSCVSSVGLLMRVVFVPVSKFCVWFVGLLKTWQVEDLQGCCQGSHKAVCFNIFLSLFILR